MRKILIVTIGSLLLGGLAFAETPKTPHTGNFRRAEVGKAAGATTFTSTSLHDANGRSDARVMAVESQHGKVALVKAPLDKGQPVTKLTTKQANKMGFTTQAQAHEMASKNGGYLGSAGKVRVKNAGMSMSGDSYTFKQTNPSTLNVKMGTDTYRASNIVRTVRVQGGTESARATYSFVKKGPAPTPAPAPAPAPAAK
jgi:hypothetical protein